jgi:hypothetical protein
MVEHAEGLKRGAREHLADFLKPEQVQVRLAVADINTAQAKLMTAEEYARFCVQLNNEPTKGEIDFADLEYGNIEKPNSRYREFIYGVLEKVCLDKYGINSNTSLLIAEPVKQSDGLHETLGACRMVFGDSARDNFIEAGELFDLSDVELPHRKAGLRDNEVAELGRVVVSKRHRPHNTRIIIGSMMGGVVKLMKVKDIKGLYLTLPSKYPARLLTHLIGLGYDLEQVVGAKFSDSEYAKETREKFPVYWKDMDPQLFYLRRPN